MSDSRSYVPPIAVIAQEIRSLRNEMRSLANWWDVLPQTMADGRPGRPPWEDVFGENATFTRLPPRNWPSMVIELITRPMADRIEITLRVDLVTVWQRAIFFAPPPDGADRGS